MKTIQSFSMQTEFVHARIKHRLGAMIQVKSKKNVEKELDDKRPNYKH